MPSFNLPVPGIWTGNPPGSLPPNPWAFEANRANPLYENLAFLLLPDSMHNQYIDLVTHSALSFVGTVTPVPTPFGPAFLFGDPSLTFSGTTAVEGPSSDFIPPSTGYSVACGTYNTATITQGASNFRCNTANFWVNQVAGHGVALQFYNLAGTERIVADFNDSAGQHQVFASGGAGGNFLSAGAEISVVATLNSGTTAVSFQNNGTPTSGSATSTASGNYGTLTTGGGPQIGAAISGGTANGPARAVIWTAGWYRGLSAMEMTIVTSHAGGLPPGIIRRRR